MKKIYIKIIITIFIVLILGILFNIIITKKRTLPIAVENKIIGCYVAHLSNDVYTLKIFSEKNETFEGELNIYNAEKDSSTGTLKGTYKNGILLADYTFMSEGILSVNQVIFKKIGNDFVRGYGKPDDTTGTRFIDLSKINYDLSVIYKISTKNCTD